MTRDTYPLHKDIAEGRAARIAVVFAALGLTVTLAACGPSESTPSQSTASPLAASAEVFTPSVPTPPPAESLHAEEAARKWAEIAESEVPELKGLRPYEQIFGGKLPAELMHFTVVPNTVEEAVEQAQKDAATYTAFNSLGIPPLAIVEPQSDGVNKADGANYYARYAAGEFNEALRAYYQALRDNGVSDIGTQIFLPEGNAPYYGNIAVPDATTMAEAIAQSVAVQKSVFPESRSGVLFENTSHTANTIDDPENKQDGSAPVTDTGDDYIERVNALKAALGRKNVALDVFGAQGVAWHSRNADANEIAGLMHSNYLPLDLAVSSAKQLGVKEVWIHTGTTTYRLLPPNKRAQLVHKTTVAMVAAREQNPNLKFWLTDFAQDKTSELEGLNFSHLSRTEDAATFARQVNILREAGVKVGIFTYQK
ncbi:hypothetical protein JNM87_04070 [Candidatus Saccharibacteria bacterium]|nr:hypothetical protein [Candidatus Saccharibacteria bacterium]